MNIMKTEMLLFDNKVKREQAGTTTVMAPIPAPVEKPEEESMNALMFKGLQNLMANPKLAEEVGVGNEETAVDTTTAKEYVAPFSSNIAFQGGKSKALVLATSALLATSLTSCIKFPEDEPDVNILIAYQDQSALVVAISSLNAQISALEARIAANEEAQAERDKQMIQALNSVVTLLTQANQKLEYLREHALTQEEYDKGVEELKQTVIAQGSMIVQAIALAQQISTEKATELFNAVIAKIGTEVNGMKFTFAQAMAELQELMKETNSILSGFREDFNNERITAAEWREKLLAELGDIKKVIGEFFNEYVKRDDENKEMIAELVEEAKKNNANWTILQPKVTALIKGQRQQTEVFLLLHKDMQQLNWSVIKTKEDLAAALGIQTSVIDQALQTLGLSLSQVISMNADDIRTTINNAVDNQNNVIIQEGEKAGQKLDGLADKLQEIIDKLNAGELTIPQAIELLKSIDQGVKDINTKLDQFMEMFKNAFKGLYAKIDALNATAKRIEFGVGINNAMTADIDRQLHNMSVDIKNIKTSAVEIKNALINGEINVSDPEVVALLKELNINVNSTKEQVVAKIDEVVTKAADLEKALNRLDKNNQSKLNYIACLIKNISFDNSDVIAAIEKASKSGEAALASAVDELIGKLDILIEKVNAELDKLDGISTSINTWGSQISRQLGPCGDIVKTLKENGKKLDYSNWTQAQLLAEVRNLKPQIQTLVDNSRLADGYLEFLVNYQPQIKASIDNIQNIGGGGITAEEMDALMKKYSEDMKGHQSNLYANIKQFLKDLHIENILKMDEAIGAQKEGNKIALDIYNKLIAKMNKDDLTVEELKAILKAIYEYLPELKCQCDCKSDCDNNQHVSEEIIGILE